ncbi:uncharacterized protein cd8b [Betta splendens]|uniref:Uncharacterized protein cd8b n=1 Tax=Betta splendens TaxID=158456 RepID=A0A6P7MQI9_BETSP|nr:uncharacterized protein cd8b [Betta splendens]
MTQLPVAWTLLAAALCSAASSHRLQTERVSALYPELHSNATVQCDCLDYCDSAYWFLTDPSAGHVQFLGRYNNADRVNYASNVDKSRYKLSKRGSLSFALQVIGVTVKDTGIYSCVLKDKSNQDMWKPGTLLLPGVPAPTSPPVTKSKPPVKKICTCKKNAQAGCGSMVLWPLVGLVAGLALAVVCTLYYFSRLPKKCRHQFVKRSR